MTEHPVDPKLNDHCFLLTTGSTGSCRFSTEGLPRRRDVGSLPRRRFPASFGHYLLALRPCVRALSLAVANDLEATLDHLMSSKLLVGDAHELFAW